MFTRNSITPLLTIFALAFALGNARPASASTSIKEDGVQPDIEIWLSEGIGRYGDREFKIRGGSQKYPTPTGAFTVQWKARNWHSRQWDAPMPYALFYYKGAALHQGHMTSHSKGCIRLHKEDAAFLFSVAKEKQTRVFVYP